MTIDEILTAICNLSEIELEDLSGWFWDRDRKADAEAPITALRFQDALSNLTFEDGWRVSNLMRAELMWFEIGSALQQAIVRLSPNELFALTRWIFEDLYPDGKLERERTGGEAERDAVDEVPEAVLHELKSRICELSRDQKEELANWLWDEEMRLDFAPGGRACGRIARIEADIAAHRYVPVTAKLIRRLRARAKE